MSSEAKEMIALWAWTIFAVIGAISTIGFFVRLIAPAVCSW